MGGSEVSAASGSGRSGSEAVPPADWAGLAYGALAAEFGAGDLKVLFLRAPGPNRLRYRYWTEKRFSGFVGLALVRGGEAGLGLFSAGPGYVLYVLPHPDSPDGGNGPAADPSSSPGIFATGNLMWADLDEPLFVAEEVDRTVGGAVRLPRPLGLGRAEEELVRKFVAAPLAELTFNYIIATDENAKDMLLGYNEDSN
jgi:hypothetical protein